MIVSSIHYVVRNIRFIMILSVLYFTNFSVSILQSETVQVNAEQLDVISDSEEGDRGTI